MIFCTETEMFLPSSRSEYHNSISEFKSDFPLEYMDINNYEFFADEILVYFGEMCLVDAYCALKLKEAQHNNKKIKLISCRNAGHLIVNYLDQKRGWIREVFRKFLEDDGIFIINNGAMDKYLKSDDIRAVLEGETASDSYFYSWKKIVNLYPSYALGLNRLGVCYEQRGDLDEALKYLLLSELENPNMENTLAHLAEVRKRRKEKITK